MPERPDVDLYVTHLRRRLVGEPLRALRIASPFVLRTAAPPPEALVGRTVTNVTRLAKRIVVHLDAPDPPHAIVIHLIITGRLHWRKPGAAIPRRGGLAALDVDGGTVTFTESAKKKRASMHLVAGAQALAAFDPGGVEVTPDGFEAFAAALRGENHTLKRALTDQRIVAGIGNAWSDEILWAARCSPFRKTAALDDGELGALFFATLTTLQEWTERLAAEAGDAFPERVTAFRPEMAVHGELLRALPDRRPAARRPGALALAEGRLAEAAGGSGGLSPSRVVL
jgi:formamidopyrimidine-DNA glycosylase